MQPDELYTLQRRIETAEHSHDILLVLGSIVPLLATYPESQSLYDVVVNAFRALRSFTADDVSQAEKIILTYLLEYLDHENDAPTLRVRMARQLRELFAKWIIQYTSAENALLRQHILEQLLQRFSAHPSHALCWTFAHIGYRTPQLVAALWDYVRHDPDEDGTALAVLAELGVPFNERQTMLEVTHQKMQQQVTIPLLTALQVLADPISIDVIRATYFPLLSPEQLATSHRIEPTLVFGVLTTIADRYEYDEALQDRIWSMIAQLYDQDIPLVTYWVNMGGNLLPHCDSKYVVPGFLIWLGQADTEQKRQERHPLLSYRVEACVRPRQVASWQSQPPPSTISLLRSFACQDTKSTGRWATQEIHQKEAAWGTLLRMGYREALTWYEEAIGQETNAYLRGQLCDLLASFCLDPLPDGMLSLVSESYEIASATAEDHGTISVRLGAIRMAQSAASWSAFEALLTCGLTSDGYPLLTSVEALADVACELAREGKGDAVVAQLVSTSISHPQAACRSAALRTLETLAEEHDIPLALLQPLEDVLLTQDDQQFFERSMIVAIFSCQAQIPPSLLPHIKAWARERDDELAMQSLALLAGHGLLLEDEPLLQRIVPPPGDHTETSPPLLTRFDWRTHLLGLLYLHHPDALVGSITEIILTASWSSVVPLFAKFRTFLQTEPQRMLHPELATALITRIRQRQLHTSAELDLIRLVAELIPETFVGEPWDTIWQDWLAEARVILADVLGALELHAEYASEQQTRLLRLLIGDGQYAVRRAAYRGLQRTTPHLLREWCWIWAKSDDVSLRLRAAEAWSWMGEEEDALALFYQLSVDPESEIRQNVHRTYEERRKRMWARTYLTHILDANPRTNEEILTMWPYAQALVRVGDDTTIQTLRRTLRDQALPPHVRHWYEQLLKETSEGWEKALKRWPQPGTIWTGVLEKGSGTLLVTGGHRLLGQYAVWRTHPETFREASSWGGTFYGVEMPGLFIGESAQLQLENGQQATLLIKETLLPKDAIVFVGQGSFPAGD